MKDNNNDIFNNEEKEILKYLIKGEKLSINRIAKIIKKNRQETLKNLIRLEKKDWIKEIKDASTKTV